MNYIIGTRKSRLSVAQTNWVVEQLQKQNPNAHYEIKTITTKGDVDSRPLFKIDQKGIFEKEIDNAVAQHRVDFAVHSLKDVPSSLPEGLTLACVPLREQVNDVFISKNGNTLDSLEKGSVIGTSSLRRAVQIYTKRSDLQVKPIRGNIETRIDKVNQGNYDGIVLAIAGIQRLHLDVKYTVLDTGDFVPSPGQGALAIVCRDDDFETIAMLDKIQDKNSRAQVQAERALSEYVESGCRFPIGAYAKTINDSISLHVCAFSVDGKRSITVQKTGPQNDPENLGKMAGMDLCRQGIDQLALNWRAKVDEWNKQ